MRMHAVARSAVCAALLIAAAASWTASAVLLPTEAIESAFLADGYRIVANVSTTKGSRGFRAQSRNTTLLSTGEHKYVFYVEGSAHDMGYLAGLLMEPEISAMVHTYVDHFLISLISVELDLKMSSDPTWSGLYDEFVTFIGDFLSLESLAHFNRDWAAGDVFPDAVLAEMQGVVDGCFAVNPATNVTKERLVTLNYGMDWLSAAAFSGQLLSFVREFAEGPNGK